MDLDRRAFARTLLLATSAGIVGFPAFPALGKRAPRVSATLVADAATGRELHRSGDCATRHSPCSTFKIPLALMGFDAGILTGVHSPAWDYDPKVHVAHRAEEKQRTDPTSWEKNSVVWYSQVLTTKLGAARFKSYVDRFGYGNRDVRGNPAKNDGLTQAWLGSSLEISPEEQIAFLRRMLAHQLVSEPAHRNAEAIIPMFEGSGGWRVHGKTGSGWVREKTEAMGWFVGWAEKGRRRIVFARFEAGDGVPSWGGLFVRKALLAEIGALAG